MRSLIRLIVYAAIIFPAFYFAPVTLAQTQAGSETPSQKSLPSEEHDKKALDKLRRMSREEVEELDKKLAEALTLFYDRDYARALPIFRQISDRVETMDVAFWYASCAAKAGENELAIKKFQQMLEVDPQLHRVRLELATVYFSMGRYDDARRELKTVLESRPPDGVKANIEKLLAAIDEKTKRLYTNVRGSLGFQWDSNVNAGPNGDFIFVPGGGVIGPLSKTQKELSDWVTVFDFAGNALYDPGEKGGFMWNTNASLYQTHTMQYYEFDFTQWRLTTGPWWVMGKSVLKVPFGYAENTLEHDHLFDTWDISPSYEYFFTPRFSLRGMFSYTHDMYEVSAPPADDRSGEDNINRIMEINPNFYFNNRNDILSFFISTENCNAKTLMWSFDAVNWAASYFKHFTWFSTWDMELYSRFKYTKRDYEAPALLWPVAFNRTDKRYNLYMVLSRNFSKYCFASLSYNFIDNQSNTELYDFDKNVWAFNIGFKF